MNGDKSAKREIFLGDDSSKNFDQATTGENSYVADNLTPPSRKSTIPLLKWQRLSSIKSAQRKPELFRSKMVS